MVGASARRAGGTVADGVVGEALACARSLDQLAGQAGLDLLVSQMNQTSSYLTQQFAAMNGTSTKK